MKIFGSLGIGVIAAALAIASVLVAFAGMYYTNFVQKGGIIEEVVKEGTITEAINFVESVKIALEDAVEYSVYKASDDLLKKGGFCELNDKTSCTEECKIASIPTLHCIPWWRIYDQTYAPSEASFVEYLKKQILKRFDEYANAFFISPDYCPQPPGNINLILDNGQIYARINSGFNKLKYDGKFFTIIDDATFEDRVDIATMKIFNRARKLFIEQDSIRNAFVHAEDLMPSNCKEIHFGNVCGKIDCVAKLSQYCKNADRKFRNYVISEIENIKGLKDGVETNVELDCLDIGHNTKFVYSEKIESSEDCPCEEWRTECNGIATECSALDEDKCNLQDGCSWVNCTGSEECYNYTDESSCIVAGCIWSGACIGEVTSCDSFDNICSEKLDCNKSLQKCDAQIGCSGSMSCIERPNLYKNARCIYDYSGSANASIEVRSNSQYPIGNSLKKLSLQFYVVSGTNSNCLASRTDDNPNTDEVEFPEWQYCKVQ